MNPVHVLVIAQNVFREVIRDRVLYIFGLFAFFLVAANRLLPEIASLATDKIFLDLGLAAIGIIALFVTIFVGTGLLNKEIEKRTVLVLLAKPISRVELILGKHLGLSAVIAALLAMMTAFYLFMIWVSQTVLDPGAMAAIALSVVFLMLELAVIIAVSIVFGVATSSLLATLLTFGVYLMGHLTQSLIEFANLTNSPSFVRLAKILYLILPDLSRLNLRNLAVYGALPDTWILAQNALYGIFYTIVLLAIASIIFTWRDF